MNTFLLSLFLLLAFSRKLNSATPSTVEIDGKPVRNDPTFVFFVLPVIRGRSPGLTYTRRIGNETCPIVIARDPSELSYSLPVEIPTPKRISILSTTLELQLQYLDYPSTCSTKPSSWTVVEELPKGWFIKMGHFQKRGDGWFKLKPFPPDPRFDKLVFCHRSDLTCGDVGIYTDKGHNAFLIVIL